MDRVGGVEEGGGGEGDSVIVDTTPDRGGEKKNTMAGWTESGVWLSALENGKGKKGYMYEVWQSLSGSSSDSCTKNRYSTGRFIRYKRNTLRGAEPPE